MELFTHKLHACLTHTPNCNFTPDANNANTFSDLTKRHESIWLNMSGSTNIGREQNENNGGNNGKKQYRSARVNGDDNDGGPK